MDTSNGTATSSPVFSSSQPQDEHRMDSEDTSTPLVDVNSRAAALVDQLLMNIPEQSDRERFISEMQGLDWRYMTWQEGDPVNMLRETTASDMKIDYGDGDADCGSEMRKSIDSFSHCIQAWTVICCPTTNSAITKRIALGEGNNDMKMVAMYDLAHAENFSAVLKNECRFVSSSAIFKAPDADYAVIYDDSKFLKWLIDCQTNDGTQSADVLQAMNMEALFHKAAYANSPNILKLLHTLISKAQLEAALEARDSNGNTPVYLAACQKNVSALHQLLRYLDKSYLHKMLEDKHPQTKQNVLELVQDDVNYVEIKTLIGYHRQLHGEDQLTDFFDTFQFSLFSFNLGENNEQILSSRIEDRRPESDPGALRNVNPDATTYLLRHDLSNAEKFIEKSLRLAPNDIHTWCNKGKYALLVGGQQNHQEAKEAALRVLDLLTDKTCMPRLKAKIDYAYFIVEAKRDEATRSESWTIFCECLEELKPYQETDVVALKAYCSYHYAKTLVRALKSDDRHKRPVRENRDILHNALNQIILLDKWTRVTQNPEYTADMWLWLSEFQYLNVSGDFLEPALEEFKQRTGYQNIRPLECLRRAAEIAEQNGDKVEGKLIAHIARNLLKVVYDETFDKLGRLDILKRVQRNCEWWMESYYWTFECAHSSAQALWLQWCCEIYFECKDLVKEEFLRCSNGRSSIENDRTGLDFVSGGSFYHRDIKSKPYLIEITDKYLPGAKLHFEKLIEEPNGVKTGGARYAMIRYILDRDDSDSANIETAFKYAYDESDAGYRKGKVAKEFGQYYRWIGDKKMSDYWSQQSVQDKKHAKRLQSCQK